MFWNKLAVSGVFKGRRARHLPRDPLFRGLLEMFLVLILFIFGEKRIIHSYNICIPKQTINKYSAFKGAPNNNCNV